MSTNIQEDFVRCRAEIDDILAQTELKEVTSFIRKKVEELSYMRKFIGVETVSYGAKPTYPLPDELVDPVWVLPGLGYVAQDYVELMAEEYTMPMFAVQAAKDWLLKYERERPDVLIRAASSVGKAIAAYETEAIWRTIIPAVTSAFDGAGILSPRPAQIYQLPGGDLAAGYFSKELVNRLIVGARRMGKNVTTLLVSPEDLADIREWTDADVDPATRRSIFQAAGLGSIWNIQLMEIEELGIRGVYNINDEDCQYGPFKGQKPNNSFNDYAITHGNIVSDGFNLEVAGETQVYALCDDFKDNFNMCVAPYTAHFDITLLRRQKGGFFGWQEMGVMSMDSRSVLMGVIDRYIPDSLSKSSWVAKQEKKKQEKEDKERRLTDDINRLTSLVRQSPEKLEALLTLLGG